MRKSSVLASLAAMMLAAGAQAQVAVGSDSNTGNLFAVDIANSANNRDLSPGFRIFGLAADDAAMIMYFGDDTKKLYSATYGSSGALGAPILIGTFTIPGTATTLLMEGLAYDSAASKLYGFALGPTVGGFYEISTEDASCTLVRQIGSSPDFPGFDYNASDDSFYVTTNLATVNDSGSESYLAKSIYRFHKPLATSVPTLVTTFSKTYSGLASVGNILYLMNNDTSGITVYDMFAASSSTVAFNWGGNSISGAFGGATWAPSSLPAPSGPDIAVTLTSATPDPVLLPPGGNVTYTIKLTNNGASTGAGVVILQDTLPTGMTFVSGSPGTWSNPSGTTWQVVAGPMAAGAVKTYTVVATPTTTGTLLNKVALSFSGFADARSQNNKAVWSTIVRQPGADLSVTASGPSACSVPANGTATFNFSVANIGDIAADNAQLAIQLPTNVAFVSSSPSLTPSGGVLTYSLGSLPNGGGATLTVNVNVISDRAARLVATATSTTLETNPADNTRSATAVVPGSVPSSASIRGVYTTVQTVNGLDNPTSLVPGLVDEFGSPVHFKSFDQELRPLDIHVNPGRPFASPDRSKLIQFWDTDNFDTRKRHVIVRRDLNTGVQSVVVQSNTTEIPTLQGDDPFGGPYYPWAIPTTIPASTFGGLMSINDAGSFAFTVARDSRYGYPGQSNFSQVNSVIKNVGGTFSLVAQSNLTPAPAPFGTSPNTNTLLGLGSAQIATDNTVACLAFNIVPDGMGGIVSPTGPRLLMKSDATQIVSVAANASQTLPAPGLLVPLTVWGNQAGGTTFPAYYIHNDSLDNNTTSGVYWNADHTRYILSGMLNPAVASPVGVVVVDGNVVVQNGQTLPGFSSPMNIVESFAPTSGMNGNYRMEADGTWFITGRNVDYKGWVMRNGSIVARSDDPITPGATERWAGSTEDGNFTMLVWGCSNPRGDYAVCGRTDNPWTFGAGVIVLNGQTVVARTGDPVDLNNNGVFDDGYYISSFGSLGPGGGTGEEVFMTNDAIYALARVQTESYVLSCGTFAPSSFALVKIPLPLSGACCAGSRCSLETQAACTGTFTRFAGVNTACNVSGNNTTPCCRADYNQSGSVTVQDIFDFISGYFSSDVRADINGASGVTVQDIFDFLGAYFAGCP